METTAQLGKRIREVLLNGHWIANTNFKEQLEAVSFEQATHKIDGLNTIATLTFHINYYLEGLIQVFEGGSLNIRDAYSFDMPAISDSAAWKNMVQTLIMNAEQFADAVEKMDEEKLESDFVSAKYGSYRRNIEGVIEHCYYHLGQISLLRKLLKAL